MSQDQTTKHAFEHTAKMEKQAREEAHEEDALNAAALQADNHTGQQGMLPVGDDLLEGTEIKALRDMLPDWHKDELRRLLVVSPGTRLNQGDIFCDLRFRERGELVAHGEEEVHEELLVPKRAVDYEIWNKLLGKPNLAG
jgi:hypothetical protein